MRGSLLVALVAVGCGGGAGASEDAGAAADADSECTRSGFAPDSEIAERDAELEVLFYTAEAGDTRLNIDFYFSLGAEDGAHTQALSGEGLDTCATCILGHAECGELVCNKTFMAQSGQLAISSMGAVGEQLTGTLQDAVLAEVVIDPGTQQTTPVPGGMRWCLEDHAFDVAVVAP